jgi:hypothetical protein
MVIKTPYGALIEHEAARPATCKTAVNPAYTMDPHDTS